MAVLAVVLGTPASPVVAAPPRVTFDAAAIAAVTDVTARDFAATSGGEKLVAARLELSSLLSRGDVRDVVHVTYRVESDGEEMTVFDYAPKTSFAPTVEGNVAIERQIAASTRFQATAAGQYFPFASGSAQLDADSSDKATIRYEALAPTQQVAAAGTLERGRGVFFKLRSGREASLEGARQFLVVWRVPRSWRAGRVRVSAQAHSAVAGFLADGGETIECGAATFDVGLHMASDGQARQAIGALLNAENDLAGAAAHAAAQRKKDLSDQVRETFDGVAGKVNKKARNAIAAREMARANSAAPVRAAREEVDRAARAVAALNAPAKFVRLPPTEQRPAMSQYVGQ